MTKRGTTPLHEARRAAAKELALPINDPRVIRLATLQCAYDNSQAVLAAGRAVDIDGLLKLDAVLAEARAAAQPPPKIELEIVPPVKTKCPKCAHEFDPKAPQRTVMLESTSAESAPPPKAPATAEASIASDVPQLPDNVARLPDARGSWTAAVQAKAANRLKPFSKPSREMIERQELGRNHSRDVHSEYIRQFGALRSSDLRSRSEAARTDIKPTRRIRCLPVSAS